MEKVVIIGGGVAGLMAAVHLAERGLRPLLLEAHPTHIGGRLRDGPPVELEHHGQRWTFPNEHGVHGIWAPYLNLKATLQRHNILPELVRSREEGWIYGQSQRIRYAGMGSAIHSSPLPAPFHYLYLFTRLRFINILTVRDLLALPRILSTLLVALAIDPIAEQRSLGAESLASFTKGWSPHIRSFFAGLARNALAAHPEEVPASGFIAFLRFYTLMRRSSWAFSYLPGTGGAQVSEPLAQVARTLGCTIRMGALVTCLEQSNGLWQVSYTEQSNGSTEVVDTSQVILALDAPACAKLLAESPATTKNAAELRFPRGVPTAIVRLWFERKPRAMAESGIFSGDFIVDNFFWLERLQPAYTEWSRSTGGSALEMHIYGPPEVLEQPDAILLAQVITDANRAFPELAGKLLHAQLLRNPATHTLFSVGEAGRHLGITTPWPGLFACGDWVAHPAPALYLERATTTGIAAANAVLESQGLEQWSLVPHPRPEWLAGKLEQAMRAVRRWVVQHKKK